MQQACLDPTHMGGDYPLYYELYIKDSWYSTVTPANDNLALILTIMFVISLLLQLVWDKYKFVIVQLSLQYYINKILKNKYRAAFDSVYIRQEPLSLDLHNRDRYTLTKCFLNLKGFNINILSFSDLNHVKTYYVCSHFEGIFL